MLKLSASRRAFGAYSQGGFGTLAQMRRPCRPRRRPRRSIRTACSWPCSRARCRYSWSARPPRGCTQSLRNSRQWHARNKYDDTTHQTQAHAAAGCGCRRPARSAPACCGRSSSRLRLGCSCQCPRPGAEPRPSRCLGSASPPGTALHAGPRSGDQRGARTAGSRCTPSAGRPAIR